MCWTALYYQFIDIYTVHGCGPGRYGISRNLPTTIERGSWLLNVLHKGREHLGEGIFWGKFFLFSPPSYPAVVDQSAPQVIIYAIPEYATSTNQCPCHLQRVSTLNPQLHEVVMRNISTLACQSEGPGVIDYMWQWNACYKIQRMLEGARLRLHILESMPSSSWPHCVAERFSSCTILVSTNWSWAPV